MRGLRQIPAVCSVGRILGERRCLACTRPFVPETAERFCPECALALPRRRAAFCPVCGEIYDGGLEGICPPCQEQRPPWGKIFFHGLYDGLLRGLILRLKFGGELHQAHGLALLLAANPELAEASSVYDVIVPIPLHKSRLIERGFNQSGEIARHLGKELNLPPLPGLERALPTRHQIGLSRRERVSNLRRAFNVSKNITEKKILLLDDVMTTGATLGSAARSLLDGGAAAVDVVVPARTRARNMLRESRSL